MILTEFSARSIGWIYRTAAIWSHCWPDTCPNIRSSTRLSPPLLSFHFFSSFYAFTRPWLAHFLSLSLFSPIIRSLSFLNIPPPHTYIALTAASIPSLFHSLDVKRLHPALGEENKKLLWYRNLAQHEDVVEEMRGSPSLNKSLPVITLKVSFWCFDPKQTKKKTSICSFFFSR